jgi:hypothetical protein
MGNDIELGDAGRQYAAAHAAHYGARDLPLALQLYKAVLASHPSTEEAGYSRTQVQNLVNAVIPRQTLLEAQMALAVAHFERDGLVEMASER